MRAQVSKVPSATWVPRAQLVIEVSNALRTPQLEKKFIMGALLTFGSHARNVGSHGRRYPKFRVRVPKLGLLGLRVMKKKKKYRGSEKKMLKVVVAGSRSIRGEVAYKAFVAHMSESLAKHRNTTLLKQSGYQSLVIMTGGAKGVDDFGKRYARENAYLYKEYKPLYLHKGDMKAPLRRNVDMARDGDILVAMWDGHSPGTKHMKVTMEKRYRKAVYVLVR